jgi:hypothetical protein
MGSHRVINKAHTRVHEDGKLEVFEIGDEIDPTDSELQAFGDKLMPISGRQEQKVDDSAPKLSSEAATKPDIALTHETVAHRPRRGHSEDKGDGA